MYNFWTSSAVEQVALQTKTKWFVPVGATENLESYYRTINTQNYPFIPWNAFDVDGNQLPAPVPIEPPTMADAFIKGMMISQNEFMMASGQREENFGQQTNADAGVAIAARQRQGDNATYHFIEGLAIAIRQVGNIILDVAPHIYTTRQLKQILAEDGTEQAVMVDPNADVAYAEQKAGPEDPVSIIFNPKIGRYWVDSDVGPSYATKRQEAWNAFVQITTANQELVKFIGDLMFRNADFPGADEIAERLKRLVPPEVLGDDPSPAMVQAQQQNKQLQLLVAELTEKLAKQELELRDKQDQREINLMDAHTRRLKEVGNAESDLSPETMRPIIEKLVQDILSARDAPVIGDERRVDEEQETPSEEAGEVSPEPGEYEGDPVVAPEGPVAPEAAPSPAPEVSEEQPPVAGARKAPDGEWYVEDPNSPSGLSRVDVGS